jgi:uncharacterized protein
MTMGLPPHLAALETPGAYPHPVEKVQLIETHISWVLLAGEFAYKIKRPVCYPFVDLRDPARRKHFCEEELRLNRRFAPELYLEVCEIVEVGGEARIGAHGPVLEHAVRMARFRRADELDRLLDARRIEPAELETFARELALIHARLPAAAETAPWGTPASLRSLLLRNLDECADAARGLRTEAEILALRSPLEERLRTAEPWMAARRAAGRIRECHGDLHCRNLVRIGSRLTAFDCMEFEPAFRWIDVADELAMLSSDLAARDRPLHAHAFLSGYLAQSGDHPACRVLKLYEAHRALVRAKVAALSASSAATPIERAASRDEHVRLIAQAAAALESSRGRSPLVLMCGLSGSGKTWFARLLAERLRAVHLRSDVERKRGAGLGELAPSGSRVADGLYASEATALLYEHLARAAEDVIVGGYAAIVDATFLRRAQRAQFLALARRLGAPLRLVCCEAPLAVLRARIAERHRSRHDPSEADEAVLEWQRTHREPVQPEEGLDAIAVSTSDLQALDRALHRIWSADRA